MKLGIGCLTIIGDEKYFGEIESVDSNTENVMQLTHNDAVTVRGAIDEVSCVAQLAVVSGIGKPCPADAINLQPVVE